MRFSPSFSFVVLPTLSGPPLTVIYNAVSSGTPPSVAAMTQLSSIATMACVSLSLLLAALMLYAIVILPTLEKKLNNGEPPVNG